MAVEALHHVTKLNSELAGKCISFASFLHWITCKNIRLNVFLIYANDYKDRIGDKEIEDKEIMEDGLKTWP